MLLVGEVEAEVRIRLSDRRSARVAVMVDERRTPAPAIPASLGMEGGMKVQLAEANMLTEKGKGKKGGN